MARSSDDNWQRVWGNPKPKKPLPLPTLPQAPSVPHHMRGRRSTSNIPGMWQSVTSMPSGPQPTSVTHDVCDLCLAMVFSNKMAAHKEWHQMQYDLLKEQVEEKVAEELENWNVKKCEHLWNYDGNGSGSCVYCGKVG